MRPLALPLSPTRLRTTETPSQHSAASGLSQSSCVLMRNASVSHLGNSHAKDSPLLTLYPSEIDPAPAPTPNRVLLVLKRPFGSARVLHFRGWHASIAPCRKPGYYKTGAGRHDRGRVGPVWGRFGSFAGVNRPNDQPGRGYRPMPGANRPGNSQPGRGRCNGEKFPVVQAPFFGNGTVGTMSGIDCLQTRRGRSASKG